MLLILLLAVSCRTIYGFGQDEVFFQFAQLAAPAFQDSLRATQDFHHRDENGVTELKYHVEHREDAVYVHLDSDKDVVAVFCNHTLPTAAGQQGNISVFFASGREDRVRRLIGNTLPVFISGGTKWGCRDSDGKVTNLMLHEGATPVRTLIQDGGRTGVNFVTEPATFMHFFENADISFRTDKYPQGWFSEHDVETEPTEPETTVPKQDFGFAKSKRATGIWSMLQSLTDTWETVKEIGAMVETAVATVVTVTKAIVTGDYQYDKTLASNEWVWNYDFTTGKFIQEDVPIDSKVSCRDCAAYATLSIQFQLSIVNRQLKSLRLVGDGFTQILGGANMEITGSYEKSNSAVVKTIHMPSIKFVIGGLPVVVDAALPITLGYDLSLTDSSVADFDVNVQGNYTFGVQYTSSNGMKFVSDSDLAHSGAIYGASFHASFTSVIYVLPTLQINVKYIGGPNVGVKIYSETNIDVAVGYPRPCGNLGGIALSSNVGLQVTIGAELAISMGGKSLYKKDWKPTGVYSLKKPLISGCYGGSVSARGGMAARALAKAGEAAGLDFAFPPSRRRRKAREPFLFEKVRRSNQRNTSQYPQQIPEHFPFTELAPLMVLDVSGQPKGYGDVLQVGCSEGVTWHGIVTRGPGTNPECEQYPPFRELSFQTYQATVSGSGPILNMVGSTVDSAPSGYLPYACVHQKGFYASIYSGGMLTFGLNSRAMNSDYTYCSGDATDCSCDSREVGLPSSFYGQTDQALTTITLEDGLRCTEATLTRIMPGTTGQFYADFDQEYPLPRNDTFFDSCGMGP